MDTQLEAFPNLELEVQQIAAILFTLPPEKIIEVRDYTLFLQARYGKHQGDATPFLHPVTNPFALPNGPAIDTNDAWNDEDQRDLTVFSLNYQLALEIENEYAPEAR